MKIQIFLAIFILSIFLNFVYAENVPQAPAPDLPVKIVTCTDSDNGLDYFTIGEITLRKVSENYESSVALPENRFDYCKTEINRQKSCDHPEKEILIEAYCNKKEINIENEPAILFKEYNCSTEGKVCYNGRCINSSELEKDTKYLQEVKDCKRQETAMERFFKKIYNFFHPPAKVVKIIE